MTGDRLIVGDAFRTPSGTWLPALSDSQELVLSVPDRFTPIDLNRPLRNGSIVIQGPVEFDPGEPTATFQRTGPTSPTPTATVTTTGTPTPTVSEIPPGSPMATPTHTRSHTSTADPPDRRGFVPILGVLIGLLLVSLLAYFAWSHSDSLGGGVPPSSSSTDSGGTPPPDGSEATAAENGEGSEAPLLSDEELVLTLLEDNDGRMKQTAIVDETDWSNAKVSQLLSELEEQGAIEKLRIGRENLITLPDEVPDGVE